MKLTYSLLVLFMSLTISKAQPTQIPGEFVHSVYFWLKNPESDADKKAFLNSLEKFVSTSKYISAYHIAPPAGTPREVVDNSYSFNLICTFASAEDQDLYQNEDVHLTFIEEANHLWEKVQIYDSYPARPSMHPYNRQDISIGVVVSDIERSVNFYTNVLGMVRNGGFMINEDFGERSGLTGGSPVEVMILQTTASANAAQFKLMSFQNPTPQLPASHIQDALGMRYITLMVNNFDQLHERLQAAGVDLLGETPVDLPDGNRFILIRDPDGIFIELIGK